MEYFRFKWRCECHMRHHLEASTENTEFQDEWFLWCVVVIQLPIITVICKTNNRRLVKDGLKETITDDITNNRI